jgi:hypothetical protein
MCKQKELIVAGAIFVAITLALFLPGLCFAGSLEPASGPPVPTMKTLDQIPPTWSQQLQCDTTACPRFELVFPKVCGLHCIQWEGVLDKETGLVWQKDLNPNPMDWYLAELYCIELPLGGRMAWRLPTVEELDSLIDTAHTNPALPSGHPFTNVQANYYWANPRTLGGYTDAAWNVSLNIGGAYVTGMHNNAYVWCVRGVQGVNIP